MRAATLEDYHRRLDRVRAHLEARLAEPPDLAELARVAALSPCHFHRVFRALTGETVGEHLRRVRLERAALLLRHSERSVTDVALATGYESPAAFSRAFERAFGESPAAWRAAPENRPVGRGTGAVAPVVSPAPSAASLASAAPGSTPPPAAISPERVVRREATRVCFVRRLGPYVESAPAA